jgi:hypothetical protein
MIVFLAHYLIVLAAWTVTIKFLFPIGYAIAYGLPLGTHIYWDLWWVAHLWLAWALLRWKPYTFLLAIGISGVEIAIVVTKFVLFLAAPEWTIWTTNWFINKLFVLLVFSLMLPYFVLRRRDLRKAPDDGARGAGPAILSPRDQSAASGGQTSTKCSNTVAIRSCIVKPSRAAWRAKNRRCASSQNARERSPSPSSQANASSTSIRGLMVTSVVRQMQRGVPSPSTTTT